MLVNASRGAPTGNREQRDSPSSIYLARASERLAICFADVQLDRIKNRPSLDFERTVQRGGSVHTSPPRTRVAD
jgi:hypothetical protein